MKRALLAGGIVAAMVPAAAQAQAQAIPQSVIEMIRAAAATGNADKLATVVEVAKATNPAAEEEIDALASRLKADHAKQAEKKRLARLESQSFFQGWSGKGEFGLGFTSGNTETTSAIGSLTLTKEGRNFRHNLRLLADYQRNSGATSREKLLADYKYDRQFNHRFYGWGQLRWDRDRFGGILQRFTQAAGLGYELLRDDDHSWELEVGPAFQQIEFNDGTSENQFASRLSSAYALAISDGLEFNNDTSFVVGTTNTTIDNRAGLTTRISRSLSARLSYNWQHESDPPVGKKKVDSATRATVVYDF